MALETPGHQTEEETPGHQTEEATRDLHQCMP